MVSPEKIKPGTINPRQDLGDLSELQNSMKMRQRAGKRAVIIPLIVKEIEDEIFDYEVIDGKRRLQSALSIQIPEVPIVLETDVKSPIDLLVMSLLSNDFRKEFSWIEKAQSYKSLYDQGLTHNEIGELVGLSVSRVGNYITTYEKWIAVKPSSTRVLEMDTTLEIVNKCPKDDVEELVEYVYKNKTSQKDTRKILSALRNFYSGLEVLRNFYPSLHDELKKVYHPHRFNPKIILLFNRERLLRTGEAKSVDRYLDFSEFPTKESAEQYARKCHGELIGKYYSEGWRISITPYTLNEIRAELKKLLEE